ncbi:MAG: KpsF/GutQ family sugar-phosphate isomerase [Pseudomonadota bacterium]
MHNSLSIQSALRTIKTEEAGLSALSQSFEGALGDAFAEACKLLEDIKGRVIVAGVGKSGHIGSKIAATLASTGTPAFFVHPAEANHGDLGMIARDDAIIALSWSGETAELKGIITYSSRFSIPMIAITKNCASTLGREATICLELPKVEEACPNGLAPTTSTIMQMAMGDSLAVALLEARGFSADDFGIYHPGGALGASLTRVGDIMHKGDTMPVVDINVSLEKAVEEMSGKKLGCVGVVHPDGKLAGIITDGDLRRHMNRNMLEMTTAEVMTESPKTIGPEALATSAVAILNEKSITSLFVIENEKPVGVVHLHDLLRIGVA